MAEKIYLKKVSLKKTQYGIKMSGKASDLIEQIQANQNGRGYINLEIKERREPDQYGNTHYIQVDDWVPQSNNSRGVSDAEIIEDAPF